LLKKTQNENKDLIKQRDKALQEVSLFIEYFSCLEC
jgi:hypothetical protein